jgi:DNA-binding response OmpR family regulator
MQAIIVAGDPEDRDYLSFLLRHAGLAVARTADAHHLPKVLAEHPVDLILLVFDRQSEAVDVTVETRAVTQAPLLLLGERLSEAEHCALLDAGADLVLERPFSSRLLTRYIRMLLRRAGTIPVSVLPELTGAGLRLDPATRRVSFTDGVTQQLTPLEFRLLYLLMTNQGQVIPADTIVERVWGYSGDGSRDLVRGLVRRLRRKIERDPTKRMCVENIPGVGYRFTDA